MRSRPIVRALAVFAAAACLASHPASASEAPEFEFVRIVSLSAGLGTPTTGFWEVVTSDVTGSFGVLLGGALYLGAGLTLGEQRYGEETVLRHGLGVELAVSYPLSEQTQTFLSFRRMDFEASGDVTEPSRCAACGKDSVRFDNQANYVGVGVMSDGFFLRVDRLVRSRLGPTELRHENAAGDYVFSSDPSKRTAEPDWVFAIGARF